MARSAEDCRHVLRAIAGRDPLDPTSAGEPVALDGPSRRRPEHVRGAIVALDFSKHGEPEVRRAFEAAVAELRAMGMRLEDGRLPDLPASELAGIIITAEALSAFESFYRGGAVRQLRDPYAEHQPEINAAVTAPDLVKAWRLRGALQRAMAEFFGRWDVIVSPNFMSVAPPVTQDLYEALPYGDPVGAVGNACGLPAIALPCGFGKQGMPVGFQIVGAPFDEATLLDLGDLYQRRTDFHLQRPPLA
jgi:aspartyl-tRNA(Asn)/glutamyl-tRNA(Gln) amidotransferase subunit A